MRSEKGLLVYFVTKGPVWALTELYNKVWQVEAQVSKDGGKTVESMVFTFEAEEHAIQFKRDINYQMEPTRLGEEE